MTKGAETYKYKIYWSPDSRKILWADKRLRLRYVNVRTGNITEIDKSEAWEFGHYSWSPNSMWIVYAKYELEMMDKIYLYSLKDKKSYEMTDDWYNSSNPTFSSDGKFVFFTSNRDFDPIYSRTEWNHAYQDMSRIYLITLAKSTDSPFKYRSDEVEVKKKEKTRKQDAEKAQSKKDTEEQDAEKPQAKDDAAKKKKNQKIKVDIDGIKDRITVLPVAVSNYYNLNSVGDCLYYNRKGSKDNKAQLRLFDLKEQKETELG